MNNNNNIEVYQSKNKKPTGDNFLLSDWIQKLDKLYFANVENFNKVKYKLPLDALYSKGYIDITQITTVKSNEVFFKDGDGESQEWLLTDLVSMINADFTNEDILKQFTITRNN